MSFKEAVLQTVSNIPYGQVLSYGTVAAIAGSPRAARQVGQILKGLGVQENKIPWWRVVNKNLRISILGEVLEAKDIQKSLLITEGWEIDGYQLVKPPAQS